MHQLIDTVLCDRYSIETLLGRKQGRRTYRATDVTTGLPVVVKLVLFDPDFAWEDLKLFEREAETLRSLDHQAIPQYLDSFEVETDRIQGFALVQSYIEAESLQDWVQAGRTFSEADLKTMATDLLGILTYLHQLQPPVIHRDIKPSNVLLGDRSGHSPGDVYLVDFGAVQTATHGGTVTVVGTYGYMPPEQFGGRSVPASDLYSLGATLIYLSTGQDPADLLQQNASIELKPHPNISASFCDWISWLTTTDLAKRPSSAQAALQAMDDASNHRLSAATSTFSLTQKPNSKIEISKTNEVLNIAVPYKQLKTPSFRPNEEATILIVVVAFLLFLLSYVLGSYAWMLLIFPIYFLHLSFLNKKYTKGLYNLKLMTSGGRIMASLSWSGKQKEPFFINQEMRSITAGPNTPKYQLNLYLKNLRSNVKIIGVRAEIQWICDEINEWNDLEITYEDSSPSGP